MLSRTSICMTAAFLLLSFSVFSYFSTSLVPWNLRKNPFSSLNANNSSLLSSQQMLPLEESKEVCERRRLDVYENRSQRRKVYDLFFINTELDWLEIRLGELHKQIDYFVILESRTTFSGEEKPLYLRDNWTRFQAYHDQIIYKELNCTGMKFKDTWARERYQRNAVYETTIPFLEGDQKPELNDVLITSDLDEIPKPTTIPILRNCAIPNRTTLHSDLYYYSFQWRRRSGGWGRLKATLYTGPSTILPDDLRTKDSDIELMHTSWHCSFCLPTLSDMINKIESFSDVKFNKEEFKERGKVLQRVRNGIDMFDKKGILYDRVEGNLNVPGILLREGGKGGRFRYLLDRDPVGGNFGDFREEDLVVEGWKGNGTWVPPRPG